MTKIDRDELLTVRQVLELLGGVSRDCGCPKLGLWPLTCRFVLEGSPA
jgi:hypothetical protein